MVAKRRAPHCLPPQLPHHEKAKGLLVSARSTVLSGTLKHVALGPDVGSTALLPTDLETWLGQSPLTHMCLGAGIATGVCVSAIVSAGAAGCAFKLSSTLPACWCQLSPQSLGLPFLPALFSWRDASPPLRGTACVCMLLCPRDGTLVPAPGCAEAARQGIYAVLLPVSPPFIPLPEQSLPVPAPELTPPH